MKRLTCILGIGLLSMAFVLPGIEARAAETQPETPVAGGERVAKELMKLLPSPRWELRLWAADNLGKLGSDAKDAVHALIPLLTDCVPAIRQSAADALGRIGPAAKEAAPALAGRLTDPTPNVRNAAAAALIAIGPDAKAIVSVATGLLDNPYWEVRRNAADVLGGIGTAARRPSRQVEQSGERLRTGGPHCGGHGFDHGLCREGCGRAFRGQAASQPAAGRTGLGRRIDGQDRSRGQAGPQGSDNAASKTRRKRPSRRPSGHSRRPCTTPSTASGSRPCRPWVRWAWRPATPTRLSPRYCRTASPTFAQRPWGRCCGSRGRNQVISLETSAHRPTRRQPRSGGPANSS